MGFGCRNRSSLFTPSSYFSNSTLILDYSFPIFSLQDDQVRSLFFGRGPFRSVSETDASFSFIPQIFKGKAGPSDAHAKRNGAIKKVEEVSDRAGSTANAAKSTGNGLKIDADREASKVSCCSFFLFLFLSLPSDH